MKSVCLMLVAFFILNGVFAQKGGFTQATTNHNLKLGLNTSFVNDRFGFSAAWEFKVAQRQSIQIELLPIFFKDNYDKTNGLGVALSYRKYISKNKEGLQGIYFSPAIKYSSLNEESRNSYKEKTTHLNLAFLFGKQWIFKSGFSLDINGGLGYFNSNIKSNYSGGWGYRGDGNYYGITPNLNIKIGYAF